MDIVQAEAAFIQKMKSKNWSIKTTLRYTHVSTSLISRTPSPLSNISL